MAALRQRCEVITLGPALTPDDLAAMDRAHLAHAVTPPDVDSTIGDIDELSGLLPPGWRPDLILVIQSGLGSIAGVERAETPSAYISVDTWHDLAELLYARHYNFVFATQKSAIPLLEATGSSCVHWLPLACDPQVHGPAHGEERFDFAFVGSCKRGLHDERIRRIETLGSGFSVAVGDALSQEDMRGAYAEARAAFNSSLSGEVNMRVFETLCMRKPLLTDRGDGDNGLLDLFEDGVHLLTYQDGTLLERAKTLCDDPAMRERLAAAGRQEVLARHTYLHRIDSLLATVAPYVRPRDSDMPKNGARAPGLHALLPAGARTVVDWGMALGASKVALRRRGVERLIGVAICEADAKRRAASYDEVRQAAQDGPWSEPVDVLVFRSLPALSEEGTDALRRAHALLRSGGTLITALRNLECESRDGSMNEDAVLCWVRSTGFAVLSIGPVLADPDAAAESVLIARKQNLTIRQAARRMYAAHPLPHISLEEIEARIPPDL
ncbi:MAG: glycosyltransferase [Candidatus Hydrogenedentes bacterium]|nr:glycosyltransferase [Candidatus Hydrogenedentota bacterium]